MKKFYYLSMAALALMATACSSDETVEMSPSSKQAIGFDGGFIDKSVRSIDDPSTTNTSIQTIGFGVYGYMESENGKIFNNESVAYSSEWTYTNTQYWTANKQYYFAAVSPAPKTGTNVTDGTVSLSNQTISISDINYTLKDGSSDNDKQTDLLYAVKNQQGQANGNSKVNFTFKHMLSKVKFSFVNGFEANRIKVSDIKITAGAKSSGIVTLSGNEETPTATWTLGNNDLSELAFGNVVKAVAERQTQGTDADFLAPNDEEESYYERLLIPTKMDNSNNNSLTVSFTVAVYTGTEGTEEQAKKTFTTTIDKSVITDNNGLQVGYAYDFKATITNTNFSLEEIEFDVTKVDGWNTTWNSGGNEVTVSTLTEKTESSTGGN